MAKKSDTAESGKPKAEPPKPPKNKQERSHKTGHFMATPPPEFKQKPEVAIENTPETQV